ncbi:MAG: Coenzyme F420 hydrogenase/dehydrogenase, beta subunit C-terminal domain [Methanosarcina mazei]|nr:Coenzyme F420 hydrogenase/dehydrogenase, beta subunit C-terminal domain [Methanosarcina mazei]
MKRVAGIENVVSNNWCIGCGICAGVCPNNRLEILFNDRGEYYPYEKSQSTKCSENCSLCYQVCPAHGRTKNETQIGKSLFGEINGIDYRSETGFFLSSHIGFSKVNGHRYFGASGGMATWTMETLLSRGDVDSVICVRKAGQKDRLFEYSICNSPEEIRKCSGSAYYPVELSSILKHVITSDKTFAVIGLPCTIKAIRLAQNKIPKLREKFKYCFGLVCGRNTGKFFLEYLVGKGGGDPNQIEDFSFRVKKKGTSYRSSHGRVSFISKGVRGETRLSREWGACFFTLQGCFFCDDVFAECANATFFDAWLPEYEQKNNGYSLVLNRDPLLKELFLSNDEIECRQISVDKIIESQSPTIQFKRMMSNIHLELAKKRKKSFPIMRETLLKIPSKNYFFKNKIGTLMAIAMQSSMYWVSANKDYRRFKRKIKFLEFKLWLWNQLYLLPSLPQRGLGKFTNKCK